MEHDSYMPMTSVGSGDLIQVADDVYCFTNQIVNLCFVGNSDNWVLVDAGMPKSFDKIIEQAEEIYGENAKPKALILTHGHFDHVGAAAELVEKWDIPVFAHTLELPFLTGKESYPEPDWTVEGGLVAKLSMFFPDEPINLRGISQLPDDGTVPGMPGWKWIHTPGHSRGQVSLFREADRTLIAGDAFITVKQDELLKVTLQTKEVNGPPRYFTPDWRAAEESVQQLAALNPQKAITGHGVPISGEELQEGLKRLADNFKELAVPDHGRYVTEQKNDRD
ncbi:MBL fold metallo-hydrolase [Oceanobacillus massiliensis]|uniref:MBL fold metallo-hydrolase n=1 Tax=Oceanobacillus massiliensis TaxID=1465765 RepID=UPI000289602E|nr:MBL fold metallo-hydrolase [Oceanobacillus massiliensis]